MSAEGGPVPSEHYTEGYYLETCGGAEFFRLYGPNTVKPLFAHALRKARLEPGLTALDLGCGRGELLFQLKALGLRAVGADYAGEALALAARTSKSPVLRCDAKRLPFRDASFDRIFFLGIMDHLHDWELEEVFAEFKRTLKPGGLVLANTCTNPDYYKSLSYGTRRAAARALGLAEPSPPRSGEDQVLHCNEHGWKDLERLFSRIGWDAEIEPRANEKFYLEELYPAPLPPDFPLKTPRPWKKAWHAASFRGPWRRWLAREFFCVLAPGGP